MKKFWLQIIFGFGIMGGTMFSQTTLASDDFENTTIFTAGGGGFINGNSATGDRPASSAFAGVNSYAYSLNNGTATLTSANFNTSGYSNVTCSLRVSSFSIASTGNGADGADNVKIEISPDGGVTYYNTIQLNGNANAWWHYTTGSGNASTAYDGDPSAVVFAPSGGGGRTTDGYSTLVVTNLPAISNLRIKITLLNNAAGERWTIDDFRLYGSSCSAPSQPNTQASSATASDIGCNAFKLSWTNGNGSRRLVVLKAGSAVTDPADLTDYTDDNTFGSGTAIGGGFVVYKGNGSEVFINGLAASTTYYWGIYEFNGTGSCVDYLTPTIATGSLTTTACSSPAGLTAIYIDACPGLCAYEGNNEIIFGETGSYGFEVNNNGPVIQYGSTSPPSSTYISTYTSNSSNLTALNSNTSCGSTVFADPYTQGYIPPNSKFMLANNCMCTPSAYDFSSLCGQTVYVIFGTNAAWPCNTSGGIFGNSNGCTLPATVRYIEADFNNWGLNSLPVYDYDICQLAGGNGDYVLFDPAGGSAITYGNNSCNVPLVVLPVQLLSFEAFQSEKSTELTWTTASEKNLSRIYIERSGSAFSFSTIGTALPYNNEFGGSYSFTDNSPLEGDNYYRLRFAETDGRSSISSIRHVAGNYGETEIYYYDGQINFNTQQYKNADFNYEVFDVSGRKLLSGEISSGATAIDVRNKFTRGVYITKLSGPNGMQAIRKFVIE